MEANAHLAHRVRQVRLDRLVEALLSNHDDDYEMMLSIGPMLGEIDAVGTAAFLKALVDSRIASGADELVLGVRLDGGHVEFALWDDGRPVPFTAQVSFLARVIGAQAHGRTEDGGVGITVTLGGVQAAMAA